MDLHFAVFLCFKTLRVAGKGPDRSYAWPAALAHLKRKGVYVSFLIYIYHSYILS